jgi:outer membrane receptor protein involved in Fe transport
MSYYFQDSFRATPRLTVNLGLRYDRTFLPPYGKENTIGQHGGIEGGADLDLNRGVYILQKVPPACEQRGYAPCIPGGKLPDHVIVDPRGRILRDTTMNWGPRIGLAYRLQQTTAIRAGVGIFYENWAGATQTSQNLVGWPDSGGGHAVNLNVPVPGRPTPTVTAHNPFPNGTDFPDPTPFNQIGWFMDPNFKNAFSMQWNFGIQHQFDANTVATVNYAGSGTRRLTIGG